MRSILAIALLTALATPAFAGTDVQRIDASEDQIRYLVESTVSHSEEAARWKDHDKAIMMRSKDLCRRNGFQYFRYAKLEEILKDDVLKELVDVARDDRAEIVIVSKEHVTGAMTCMTQQEIQKAAAARRKAERKAEKERKRKARESGEG